MLLARAHNKFSHELFLRSLRLLASCANFPLCNFPTQILPAVTWHPIPRFSMTRVRILLLNAALGPLDYRVPSDITSGLPVLGSGAGSGAGSGVGSGAGSGAGSSGLALGSVVLAPLGSRRIGGVVWEDDTFGSPPAIAESRLRSLLGIVALPPIAAPLRRLVAWVSDYYLAPPGAVLRMVLPAFAFDEAPRAIMTYRATGAPPKRMTVARRAALLAIGDAHGTVRELAECAAVSVAVIRGLVTTGTLESLAGGSGIGENRPSDTGSVSGKPPVPALPLVPDPGFARPVLSEEQQSVAAVLVESVQARRFDPLLLDGVTGSGKTETYMEAIAAALREGQQALVLLPEIALTEVLLTRFAARFGCEPTVWHSGVRLAERRRSWQTIVQGSAKIIIGARSALFLPYYNLGVIIVDEAHEASFKQEEGVRYHARDVAVMRARFEAITVILASATPALESLAQVEAARYQRLVLPVRYGGAKLPHLAAIDMCANPPDAGTWLSPPLVAAIRERLEKREQSLLFLNRRGYAPLTLCQSCGYRFQCPNCSFWMVEHRSVHRLACHHCGLSVPPPRACRECGDEDALVACGPGVERVADEVKLRFPTARVALATSDTLRSPAKAAAFVTAAEQGSIDIIIGTQLVTKGYHFPNLTLVGVVDADLGLEGGDLRAAERSFQQVQQVAGRAGRSNKPGEVLIQTRLPDAPVIAALVAGDRDGFYAAEATARRRAGSPPYGRLAALIVSSQDSELARRIAGKLSHCAPRCKGAEIYGPAPAPLAMLRGRHRIRLLVHARRNFDLQGMIRHWLTLVEHSAKVRVAVDIDPYNFM